MEKLTPELDRQKIAFDYSKSQIHASDLAVYLYINELQKESADDEANVKKAAVHFDVPVDVIEAIYPKVSELICINSSIEK